MSRRGAAPRVVSTVAGLWGAALVARPAEVTRQVLGRGPAPATWVVRLLGGRLLAQHVLVLARPTRGVVLAGVVVDGLHAASMVALALASDAHRRAAAISAASAAASAGVGLLVAPRAQR